MPATEEFSRDQNTLHQWFGLTGILMLVTTLWMFGADHNREWKEYQGEARDVELAFNQWRQLQTDIEENSAKHAKFSSQLLAARAAAPSPEEIQEFKDTYAAYMKSSGASAQPDVTSAFASVDASYTDLEKVAKQASAKRAAYNVAAAKVAAAEQEFDAARAKVGQAEEAAGKAAKKEDGVKAVEEAKAAVAAAEKKLADARVEAEKADSAAIEAEMTAAPYRKILLDRLDSFIKSARYEEDLLLSRRKFKAAEFDAAKANKGLMVRDGKSDASLENQQVVIERVKGELDILTFNYQAASQYRKDLQEIIRKIGENEDVAKKGLEAVEADKKRLETAYKDLESTYFVGDFPWLGKRWLDLPIIDAFGSRLRPDNLHFPKLTVDYNFKKVARFDRCTTCHKLIDKSLPGLPTTPAYVPEHEIVFEIATPKVAPEATTDDEAKAEQQLLDLYGFRLNKEGEGLLDAYDVTITYVRGRSFAAESVRVGASEGAPETLPGLMVGDVILKIGDDKIQAPFEVRRVLLETAKWGEPIRLTVRRGLPQPYTTHPRLDLYLSSSSPHPLQTTGCSICHEGQSGATAFMWASHSPNTVEQGKDWAREHGWFDNHHWIFPMYEKRFAEATCLKCHHEVTELEPSERFPEPPAPKVVRGHELIRRYGCFGCHEINGYDGAKRIGPDMRLEPNFYAVAESIEFYAAAPHAALLKSREPLAAEVARLTAELGQLAQKATPLTNAEKETQGIAAQQEKLQTELTAARAELAKTDPQATLLGNVVRLAGELVAHPEDSASRDRLRTLIDDDAALQPTGKSLLPTDVHALATLLKEPESAGTLRKVGPSLRKVKSKDDEAFLLDWIRNPGHFRPTTLMPKFFGHFDHLDGPALKTAEEFEPLEIRGMTMYLLSKSQTFDFETPPAGIAESTPDEKIARGKAQFETRGCLACHNHADFPEATAARGESTPQGPDLTGLAGKFDKSRNPNGPQWLYSWIRHPTKYHPRTRMPDLFLEPIKQADGRLTDPVADLVEYLLSGKSDWQPVGAPLPEAEGDALDRLALEHLRGAFSEQRSREILKYYRSPEEAQRNADSKGGIPATDTAKLKGAEVELLGDISVEKKLLYVGRKAIGKYGCYACHDIPGFEDAKPIGTGLADWGRKNPTMLAFNHIAEYLHEKHDKHGGHGAPAAEAKPGEAHPVGDAHPTPAAEQSAGEHDELGEFYVDKLHHGSRIGFIAQKLFEPRSYDYQDVENKPYNDRLRMPKFPLDAAEREAVVTFVLGLVNEPPVEEYLYKPNPRQQAILEGKQVLEKYNCGGCHILELPQWDIAYRAGEIKAQKIGATFPFLLSDDPIPPGNPDRAGMLHAVVHGLPALNKTDGGRLLQAKDSYDLPLDEVEDALSGEDVETYGPPSEIVHNIQIWSRALIYGPASADAPSDDLAPIPYDPSGGDLAVAARLIRDREPADGGMLPLLIHAPVFNRARKESSAWNNKGTEVWGWLPPPLVGEGLKVQPRWLHDFLLDPYPIRPAVVLRMPKFNMSSDEATKLVNYFAAVDGAEYPYAYDDRLRSAHLDAKEAEFQAELKILGPPPAPRGAPPMGDPASAAAPLTRFDASMRIVVTTCAACHKIGDFNPGGDEKAKGPNLADVYRRMRPEYVRRWLANPTRILPYTPMPVNFDYIPGVPYEGGLKHFHKYPGTGTQQLDAVADLLMNYDTYSRGRSSITRLYDETKKWEVDVMPPTADPAAEPPAAPPAGPPAAPPANE